MPGHEKIVSVRMLPVRYAPKSRPRTVITGMSALRSACLSVTIHSFNPFARAVRVAEVTSDHAGDVVAKARRKGIVQVELCAQSRDRGAIGALADHRFDRIAGSDIEQQERDDEHAEQRWDRQQHSAQDEVA